MGPDDDLGHEPSVEELEDRIARLERTVIDLMVWRMTLESRSAAPAVGAQAAAVVREPAERARSVEQETAPATSAPPAPAAPTPTPSAPPPPPAGVDERRAAFVGETPRPIEPEPSGSEDAARWTTPQAEEVDHWVTPAPVTLPSPSLLGSALGSLTARMPALPSTPEGGLDLRATLADLEERMAGRALAWVGGVALVLGAILFLGYAISQGWIGPELRVGIGIAAGAAALGLGALLMERGDRLLGHVLTPVGLAVITIALFAATQLYDLIPVEVGLLLALAAAIVTAAVAVRANAQIIAAFGLVSVLLAPPILGASPDLSTLAFVGVALVGTTAISLWRTWPWLPALAFVLSAPQMASWLVGESQVAFGLAGLAAFTVLQAVAAGGEEFRRRRDDLSPSSATLLIASAAFLVWGGFTLLDGDLAAYRMTFLICAAFGYAGLGAFFLVRDGDRHLFGLLAAATGIAALTMAFPIGMGAPAVPVAWSVEAAALAWVAIRRPHPYSALVAAALYAMAGGWLAGVVFAPDVIPAHDLPFGWGGGFALATFLGAAAVGVAIVPILSARYGLSAIALAVAAWCSWTELTGGELVIGWTAIAVVAAILVVGLPLVPTRAVDWRPDGPVGLVWPSVTSVGPWTHVLVPLAGAATILLASAHLLVVDLGVDWRATPGSVPFIDATGLTVAAYLAGLLVIGALIRHWAVRQVLACLGLVVATVASAQELGGAAVVAATMGLIVLSSAASALEPRFRRPASDLGPGWVSFATAEPRARHLVPGAMVLAGLVATVHLLLVDFGWSWSSPASGVAFVHEPGLALAIYLAALVAVGWIERSWALRQALASLGLLVTAVACARELGPVPLVAAWSALAVLGFAGWRLLAELGGRAGAADAFPHPFGPTAWSLRSLAVGDALRFAATLVGGAALTLTLVEGLPPRELGHGPLPAVPFSDDGAAMAAILAAGAVLCGVVTGGAAARRVGVLLALGVVVYAIPFEVEAWAVVVLWSALAVAAFVASRSDVAGRVAYLASGGGVLGLAVGAVLLVVAPPMRLVVPEAGITQTLALQSIAAMGAVTTALAIGAVLLRQETWARWLEGATGLALLYTVSIGIVDAFSVRVGGSVSLEELRWQSQAALSVAWAILGMVAFVVGLRTGRAELRIGGLGLLAVTTAKVFVIDLAALDTIYKVAALFGLGVVLLVSAGLWQRLHTRPPRTPPAPHGPAAVHP